MADAVSGDTKLHAAALVESSTAMRGRPLPEQRKLYKAVSNAAISLAAVAPPSRSVADQLFVAYCPMAPGEGGRWLQATPAIANPYFATSMKVCGTVERTIPTVQPGTRPSTAPSTAPATGGVHDGHRKDGTP